LQKIARGTNRVGELIRPKDIAHERTNLPMRFEIEVELESKVFAYSIAFEFPVGFKELRVFEEKLSVDKKTVYSRELAKVHLSKWAVEKEANFFIDWHLVALPIIQQQTEKDPVFFFRQWLSRMLILRPMPSMITGQSQEQTLQPDARVIEIGSWFAGLMAHAPSSYSRVFDYLKEVMTDLDDITNPAVGAESRSLFVQFSSNQRSVRLPFEDLSDGEKCFMISSLVLAANRAYGPLLCFWDEPDNYLAPSEVGHFVVALRKAFQTSGQLIATSHNMETIRRFSDENTLVLYRNSHLEPTLVRLLEETHHSGDLVSTLVRGDLDLDL
jgi:AAA domain, putative AbiEii toxin, Type IV TA system